MMEDLFDTIDAASDFSSGRAPLERALGEMERELVFLLTMECALATGAGGGGMAEEDDTFFLSFTMLYRKIHRICGKRQKCEKQPSTGDLKRVRYTLKPQARKHQSQTHARTSDVSYPKVLYHQNTTKGTAGSHE